MAAPRVKSLFAKNCRVFDDSPFALGKAVAIPECDLRTRVLSTDLAFPAILAPWLQSIDASRRRSRGGSRAEDAGLAYTLSTISGHKWKMSGPLQKDRLVINSTGGGTRVAEGPLTALVALDSRR